MSLWKNKKIKLEKQNLQFVVLYFRSCYLLVFLLSLFRAFWPGSILIADQLQVLLLLSQKIKQCWNRRRIITFKKFSRLRVTLYYMPTIHIEHNINQYQPCVIWWTQKEAFSLYWNYFSSIVKKAFGL